MMKTYQNPKTECLALNNTKGLCSGFTITSCFEQTGGGDPGTALSPARTLYV